MVRDFDQNSWALILGGSSGLGLASAKKLARHGMNVCIVHRTPRAMLDDLKVHFQEMEDFGVKVIDCNADALNPAKRREIISTLKSRFSEEEKVNLLVHSIAKGSLKPMGSGDNSLSGEDFRITADAMAFSLYDWTTELQAENLFAKESSIVSFTSEGSSKAWRNYAAVSSAKAALEAVSRSIALEFAQFGIRSNCIQAGVADTAALRAIPDADKIMQRSKERNPFQRLTTPEDVANVVYLLARPEARWINGTVIKADGGESLQ